MYQQLLAARTMDRERRGTPSGAKQLKMRDLDVECTSVLVDHSVAAVHSPVRSVKRTSRDVIEARARSDQRHLTHDALAHHFVHGPAPVGDGPAARQQLNRDL